MTGPHVWDSTWIEPASGQTLSYRVWQPQRASGLVVIIHGFGEHGGRYHHVAQALAGAGLCVAAPDLRGHGRSGGRRGEVADVARCAEELQRFTEQVLVPRAGVERYAVFGHSFGGLVAIHWALRQPPQLRRLVVQSPLLEVGFPLPWGKQVAAALLSRLWPTAALPMGLDVTRLSHDPAVIEAYRSDPLVHHVMTAGTYRSILQARDAALARAAAIGSPVLLLCGAQDQIISVPTALRWFERLACEKRQVVFPDCYHELHHERVLGDVLELVRAWVLADG